MYQGTSTRRDFVRLSKGAALWSAFWLTPQRGVAQQSPAPVENIASSVTPDIDLIKVADLYVEAAIERASSIAGNSGALSERFNTGRQIFIAAQERLRDLVYDISLAGFPVGLETPPVTFSEFLSLEQTNLAALNGTSGMASQAAADLARKAMAKILAAFGVGEAAEVFFALLDLELKQLGTAIAAKNWRAAARVVGVILQTMVSRAFLVLLGERIGVAKAGRLIAKIAGRFVPFLGWALIIGQLIWAFGEEFL